MWKRGHQVKTAEQLEPGDLAMILDDMFPDAYHRPVLERWPSTAVGVVVVRWNDEGAVEERPLVNYHRTQQFDIAKDFRSVRRR